MNVKQKLYSAYGVVRVKEENQGKFFITIFNTQDCPKTIMPGTRLALLIERKIPELDEEREIKEGKNERTRGEDSDPEKEKIEEDERRPRQIEEVMGIDLSHLEEGSRQKEKMRKILIKFEQTFMKKGDELGKCNLTEFTVETGNEKPICTASKRASPTERATIAKLVEEMNKSGVIKKSMSQWGFPIVLVSKPDGSTRFCVNYHKLNEIIGKPAYELPRIDDYLEANVRGQVFQYDRSEIGLLAD